LEIQKFCLFNLIKLKKLLKDILVGQLKPDEQLDHVIYHLPPAGGGVV